MSATKPGPKPVSVFSPLVDLRVGAYAASDVFRSVDEHVAVCRPGGELIAVTGPEDDITGESERVARLFAASPDLLLAAQRSASDPCRADPLHPCWAGRPGDVPGRHWGGGDACASCTARAAIVKVQGALPSAPRYTLDGEPIELADFLKHN